jgi:hypothetical protein
MRASLLVDPPASCASSRLLVSIAAVPSYRPTVEAIRAIGFFLNVTPRRTRVERLPPLPLIPCGFLLLEGEREDEGWCSKVRLLPAEEREVQNARTGQIQIQKQGDSEAGREQ